MFNKEDFTSLVQRYKELSDDSDVDDDDINKSFPYELDAHIVERNTGLINAEYINFRFEKYLKSLENENLSAEQKRKILNELHSSFAELPQEEQKFANIFLHDVQNGDAILEEEKTLKDYIARYQYNAKNEQINRFASLFGLDTTKLNKMMNAGLTDSNINEYGRFDKIRESANINKAKEYFEALESSKLPTYKVRIRLRKLLQDFIIKGGFDL